MPLDYQAIEQTVKKTNRVLVLHEDNLTGGIGAEIAAWISEHCFQYLDAPVMRCASLDTPIPFSSELEQQYLAKSRLHDAMQKLLNY
jgi:2-oxoisovalerate dehydrogenase E1 component